MRGEDVTIHRHTAGAVDAHGNATATYTDVAVRSLGIAPRSGEEPRNNRDMVVVGLTVYLPPGTEIDASDEMTVRGERYTVEGEPGVWANPITGTRWGVQVALELVEG